MRKIGDVFMLGDIKLVVSGGDCPSCRFFDDFGCVLSDQDAIRIGSCYGIIFKEMVE